MTDTRTQVCIVGGGPSGLALAQLLHRAGIDSVVIERRSRAHVLARIRAGVLEDGTVATLARAGVADRLAAEGHRHAGVLLAARNAAFRIDFDALIGRAVTVYGQTEVTADLYAARDAAGGSTVHGADGVALHGLDTAAPSVTWQVDGREYRVHADWIAGCDGYHGPSRAAIPPGALQTWERTYPFGWLGILSETPPAAPELIYANHERGFALASMRGDRLSRYYIQTDADDDPARWSDAAFWDELRRRLPDAVAQSLRTGPAIEKSLAPLRSFVAEPMRWGRLCLVGDAAHIVPPTGAKGLNLAIGDVHYLERALVAHYAGDDDAIDAYSDTALARVWQAVRFSWWFTTLMHRFPDATPFDQRMQEAELAHLAGSRAAQADLAESYVGLPY